MRKGFIYHSHNHRIEDSHCCPCVSDFEELVGAKGNVGLKKQPDSEISITQPVL